ncbi:unnamed protein product [Arctogadus glacialis]
MDMKRTLKGSQGQTTIFNCWSSKEPKAKRSKNPDDKEVNTRIVKLGVIIQSIFFHYLDSLRLHLKWRGTFTFPIQTLRIKRYQWRNKIIFD